MTNVLVVEDNSFNWKVFEKVLTKLGGFAAQLREDVETIIEIVKANKADIILMNICLENSYYNGKPINGIEITKLLKANPQTAKVSIMLVTAIGTIQDSEHYIRLSGADGFMGKPIVDNQMFISQIKSLIFAKY
ncbi:MAG: response regulator [Okeania sp. SIO2F4]|uniref:response regulator n=1 Tax=Okeania sp. SIO2F4 TaxID=2607790 RepID=UPI0014295975|nr:response regulator [Okeania sp. SIO2F4]MDJ0517378.1 response regulator [Trichodesmium sp. MO_231.B1]NES01979.1 response regulator [Okeania sp. SIO2F4]